MSEDAIRVVPANEASCEDLQLVLGQGDPYRCQCQRFTVGRAEWTAPSLPERAAMLRAQTRCDTPESPVTSGLVAYVGSDPAGWCAVAPRTSYPQLLAGRSPVPWKGRDEDRYDDTIWALTCFVTRLGFRHRGVSAALVEAAVGFARTRGARALEGYPMRTQPGKEITWGELFVGARSSFVDAGFVEVSAPTSRRVVMRVEL